jgi:nitrate reductase delta subunit
MEATTIARCLRYPSPQARNLLETSVATLADGSVRKNLQRFLDEVAPLTLGEWEELHTRTLDLSPQFVPYVGHIVWGESYKRGAFMAELNREMAELGMDLHGELPDHLEPVLRYLDTVAEPNDELVSVLPKAIDGMIKELKKSEADNPYRHVLAAVRSRAAIAAHVEIGGRNDE